jgi:DNA transformation protein
MADDSFHAFVKELFARLGPIQVKRMFGGAGVYAEGLMFGLLADDAIHIRAKDPAMQAELRAAGSGPFIWVPQNGPRKGEAIDLGYWRLPDTALEDPDEAAIWGAKALALARAKALSKRQPGSKQQPRTKPAPRARAKTAKRKSKP